MLLRVVFFFSGFVMCSFEFCDFFDIWMRKVFDNMSFILGMSTRSAI